MRKLERSRRREERRGEQEQQERGEERRRAGTGGEKRGDFVHALVLLVRNVCIGWMQVAFGWHPQRGAQS